MSRSRNAAMKRSSRLVTRLLRARLALSAGEMLYRECRSGRPRWVLSGGEGVPPEVAEILIRDALIVPEDGALFSDTPGQSWRMREPRTKETMP